MFKTPARIVANLLIAVGLFLLIRILHNAVTGALVSQLFAQSHGSLMRNLYALGLSLPVPVHVISVGLVLQGRWLPPRWARAGWLAAVVSGCWLGAALGIKVLIL
ncbi:MAG: hypothetical protein GTN81_10010 [Proteobacteria bacterium]|nr:hypothetical protein [Pseudomonadota bacterium]